MVDGTQDYPIIIETTDNRWSEIMIGNLAPGETKRTTVMQTLRVRSVQFSINPNAVGTTFPSEVEEFMLPVSGLFESDTSVIQEFANRIIENETNPYLKAKRIFENVVDYLTYEQQTVEHGALWAYNSRKGDCTEHSNLFIALARAAGIPAKAVVGKGFLPLYSIGLGSVDLKGLGHEWAIIYLPNIGWVPLDAVWPSEQGSFGKTDYLHIVDATTGGEGIVTDGSISWPGPGSYSWKWSQTRPTRVVGSWSGTITSEILVEPELQDFKIVGNTLTLTLAVKNTGQQTIDNASASISVDPTYFEILTPAQGVGSLTSGSRRVLSFDVRVKEAAYDKSHTFTANVTYDSSYGTFSGTFLAKGDRIVSIPSPSSPPAQQSLDVLTLVLVAVLIGSVVTLAAALLRRR
ncbi:MAG: transglutaminase domain-containing protein [Candidatus Hadarchaeaceae archaeon]